jgi:hypothetical protein
MITAESSSPASGSAAGQPAQLPAMPAAAARLLAVRLQRHRVDAPPDAHLVLGHRLVAEHADQGGGERPARRADRRCRPGQLGQRLGQRDRGRGRDRQDHQHPGDVLGAGQPEGVAAVGAAPGDRECDQQGRGGEHVAQVVEAVGEQRHRAADGGEDELDRGGQGEPGGGDHHRPRALVLAQPRSRDRHRGVAVATAHGCRPALAILSIRQA